MKKYFLLFSFFLALFFNSCKKDENENKTNNYFILDGVKYETPNGSLELENSIITGSGGNFQFTFHDNSFDDFNNIAFLCINSNSLSEVSVGTYNFGSEVIIGKFYYGAFTITGEEDPSMEVESGTVNVTQISPKYIVDYDVTLTNSKNIKGHFEGNLVFIDLRD